MKNTEEFDKDLNPVLESAENNDLTILVEYLKEKFSEGLTNSEVYKKHSPNHTEYPDLIAKEIREMGGNTFANAVRGNGPSYYEIVCDVANKLKATYNKKRGIEEVEDSILEIILEKALNKMTKEEKEMLMGEMSRKGGNKYGGATTSVLLGIFRAGGFKSYQLTLIIANVVAKSILGQGLSFAANQTLVKVASVASGPIGWAISGIWTAIDLAGPSYKVTIPSVIQVAMLRKRINSVVCKNCEAVLPDISIKFCSECGKSMNDE